MTSDELEQVEVAGLRGLPTEAWTVEGTNKQNSYSTHGMFRYFGKFPPPIASRLIAEHTAPGDLVIDAMAGSGTTGVEALFARRPVSLLDVNPLSALICRAKTTRIDLVEAVEALDRVVDSYSPASPDTYPLHPVGLRNPEHWFLPETADSIRGLHRSVMMIEEERLREVLYASFVATIRRVSRATTQQGRLFLDVDTAVADALPLFVRRAEAAITAASELPTGSPVDVREHDARIPFPEELAHRAKLVILHPPYFNAYRYSRVNSLELAWMGQDQKAVREREVHEFFKVGRSENAPRYVAEIVQVLEHTKMLLATDATLVMMIGDTRIKGDHVPVTRMILEGFAAAGGLKPSTLVLRVPRNSEASWVASQRRGAKQLGTPLRDYLVTFRVA